MLMINDCLFNFSLLEKDQVIHLPIVHYPMELPATVSAGMLLVRSETMDLIDSPQCDALTKEATAAV